MLLCKSENLDTRKPDRFFQKMKPFWPQNKKAYIGSSLLYRILPLSGLCVASTLQVTSVLLTFYTTCVSVLEHVIQEFYTNLYIFNWLHILTCTIRFFLKKHYIIHGYCKKI